MSRPRIPAHTWETLEETDDIVTLRMAVPGGWLYRVEYWGDETGGDHSRLVLTHMTATFVPDPAGGAR